MIGSLYAAHQISPGEVWQNKGVHWRPDVGSQSARTGSEDQPPEGLAKTMDRPGGYGHFLESVRCGVYGGAPSRWVSTFFAFGGMLLDPRLQVLILLFYVLPKRASSARKGDPALRRAVGKIGARGLA